MEIVQLSTDSMFSPVKSEGTRYFFLSRSGARDLAARSTMIYKRKKRIIHNYSGNIFTQEKSNRKSLIR